MYISNLIEYIHIYAKTPKNSSPNKKSSQHVWQFQNMADERTTKIFFQAGMSIAFDMA